MRFPELHVVDAFDRLRDEMERVVNRLGVGNGDGLERSAWIPSADLSERDSEFEIRCEIPGVDPSNIEVGVSGRSVTISGHKEEVREEKDEVCRTCECRYGSFRRSFTLPTEIDADAVRAEGVDGILTVTVPKGVEEGRRRVPVHQGRGVATSRGSKSSGRSHALAGSSK